MITDMNDRAQEIFKLLVDSYLSTGEPVGSRTLSKIMSSNLSPASIRNVMADLEDLGLLYAPHTSAGRLPTESGLRLFVDALMEVHSLKDDDRRSIERLTQTPAPTLEGLFDETSKIVSGLSNCATIVATPKLDRAIRQIQFLPIAQNQILGVLVFADGTIENRVIALPDHVAPASLTSAANYLNARLEGRTLGQTRKIILEEIANNKTDLDALSTHVVEQGLAVADRTGGHLFVRGTAELLKDVKAIEELESIQKLIDLLERQETMVKLLEAAEGGQGVRIFIGSENRLFQHAGLSMVVAPARGRDQQVVGAIGVIGPTRLNYGRVVPIVDYTSQVITRLIG